MKFSSIALTALSLMSSMTPTVATFQNDSAGSSRGTTYAAGMVVGPDNIIFYTGLTYDPSALTPRCFLATSSFDTSSFSELTTFSELTPIGDTCRAIGLIGTDLIAVAGTTDPSGRLNYMADRSLSQWPEQGFAMTIDAMGEPVKGQVLSSFSHTPYPVAVVGDPEDANAMYIASMTANQDYNDRPPEEDFPNWTRLAQYGSTFELTVEKFYPLDELIVPAWIKYFDVEPLEDGTYDQSTTVHVGGMINKPGVGLIVAGSTAAKGEAYGTVTDGNVQGFVTILDPSTGEMANADADESGKTFQRFGSDILDIVTNICDDPFDPNAFYIVGATFGDIGVWPEEDIVRPPRGSMSAFISKVSATSLDEIWTTQLGAYKDELSSTVTEALGCATNEIGSVYVVGQVTEGAGMIEEYKMHQSQGGQDVWIARIDTQFGRRVWVEQVGTEGDDYIARSSPVIVDNDGNAIVYGNTNGNLYRDREIGGTHDLFVIHFAEHSGYFQQTNSGDVQGMTIHVVEPPEEEDEAPVHAPIETELHVGDLSPVEAPVDEFSPVEAPADENSYVDNLPQGDTPTDEIPNPDADSSSSTANDVVEPLDVYTAGDFFRRTLCLILLSMGSIALIVVVIRRCRRARKMRGRDGRNPPGMYDASAGEDMGYDCDADSGIGVFRMKGSNEVNVYGAKNLNYRDEPEDDDEDRNGMGNFHRTYEPTIIL